MRGVSFQLAISSGQVASYGISQVTRYAPNATTPSGFCNISKTQKFTNDVTINTTTYGGNTARRWLRWRHLAVIVDRP